jgi:hypothetical protein
MCQFQWSPRGGEGVTVARALAMLRNKRVELQARKHDNLPV